ncbi:putative endo-beta-1,4-glucanase D [Colletotrichum sp. SAR 10_99]|nr:putative endo-beta-1,4-glucanase D [Colletotrichum sp. SAR 10_99]
MKFLPLLVTLATTSNAHSIFQRLAVDGVDQGQLKGVRAPEDDSPITNLNDANFACNKNLVFLDKSVITVPAGANVGTWWGHGMADAIVPGDVDHPIAESHKEGPIMAYLAKVDNAATASPAGLRWFKIAESGLQNNRIHVKGSGTNTGVDFAEFPGTYQLENPGLVFNIYDDNGGYDPTGKKYSIPGPKVLTC